MPRRRSQCRDEEWHATIFAKLQQGLEDQLFHLIISSYFYPLIFYLGDALWDDANDGIWDTRASLGRYFGMERGLLYSAIGVITQRGSSEMK